MSRVRDNQAGGFALALVLVVLAISVTLGLAFLASASVKTASSRNLRDAVRADYIAESGVFHSLELFKTHGLTALDTEKGPYYGDGSTDGYLLSARCTDTANNIYEITSICTVNGVRRTRKAKVKVVSRFKERVESLGPLWYWRLGDAGGLTAVDETGQADGTYLRTEGEQQGNAGFPGNGNGPPWNGNHPGNGNGPPWNGSRPGNGGDDDDEDDDDDDDGRGRGNGRGNAQGRPFQFQSIAGEVFSMPGVGSTPGEVAGAIIADSDGAAQFDGVDDCIDLGEQNLSGDKMTIIAWIDPGDFSSTDGRIISKADGTSPNRHDWMISYEDVGSRYRLRFRLTAGGSLRELRPATARLEANTWQFVAAVYDGGSMKLYQNGELVAETSQSGTIATSTKSVWIGGNPDDQTVRPWPGKLDEIAVFQKALTKEQVRTIYKARWPDVKVLSWLD